MKRAVGLVSLLALALGGCEGIRSEANAEIPTWKHRAGWVMSLDFSRQIVAHSREVGEPYERGEPEVDPKHRRVFVGSSDGGLYAVSATGGELLWRFETLSFVQSAPLYDAKEDVLYFGSHDGALYKVEAEGGKLIWRLSTNAEVARRPVLSGGTIYFANANDTLIAADATTGQIRWTQHRAPATGMEVAGYAGPVIKNGLAYMGFSDGTATAYDAVSGDERWQAVDLAGESEQVLGEIPKYFDVDTTPEVFDTAAGTVAVYGSYASGVYALDSQIGTIIWQNNQVRGVTDVTLWEQPAYVHAGIERPKRRLLIVSTGTTGLWALDPEDGATVWHRDLPAGGVSKPVSVAGTIMVNASQMGTYLLSPVDGSLIDGIHFEAGLSGAPAAFGRRAYTLTNGGTLLAFSIQVPSAAVKSPPAHHSALEGF